MKYRELLEELRKLPEEQLDCDVTVEDAYEGECRLAELRFATEQHTLLDVNHPIIFVP